MSQTFNLPAQAISPNVELDSPGQTLSGSISSATITLTDPHTLWPTTADNTRHIKIWGVQINRNDGAGWLWWLYQGSPTDSTLWLPFGSRTKGGGLPDLLISSGEILAAAGYLVRLAILTDAAITLGAQIVLS